MRRAVGLIRPIDHVLLVEDRFAREFIKSLLRKIDQATLLRSEIVDVGGCGEISKIIGVFPKISTFRIIGVYDGDSFEKVGVAERESAIFLPGDFPVEEIFRLIIEGMAAAFGEILGRAPDEIAIALANIRGLDQHDWFEELNKQLNITYSDAMYACFTL